MHGLPENYWETENQVIDRLINIFKDILDNDLTEYIEEITDIGRRSRLRPIKIELISKRMKKNILNNYGYFAGTGLSVTEFLSSSVLREQKELKCALHTARQNGHHAIIRNNVLIINGREVKPTGSIEQQPYTSPRKLEREQLLKKQIPTSPLDKNKEQEKVRNHTFQN